MKRPVLVKAGTEITCEHGHRIASVATDITDDSLLEEALFRDATQPLAAGNRLIVQFCRVCGAPWIKARTRDRLGAVGTLVHTPDGWK